MDSKTGFENILTCSNIGYAYLDAQYSVLQHNLLFTSACVVKGQTAGQAIFDLLPEAVGLQQILAEIAKGQRDAFLLENINREKPDGSITYFHLSFFPLKVPEAPLLCLVHDTTSMAVLQQQVAQQHNEISLLEGLLRSQSDYSTVRILGESDAVIAIRNMIEKISGIPTATILLTGKSGTGKSMTARVIHYTAIGSQAPFVEINCAAIPDTLLESELFGYEKGAFTNALSNKEGLLETANGGTLFLDEIGDMPMKLQAKLLSFLETRRFRRLGSTREIEVKIRLIAATNSDLEKLVEAGDFREDLYYRLNVVKIQLPSLNEMGNDVIIIARDFLNQFNMEFKKSVKRFTQPAINKLLNYHWPGNVRELRNVIERAMIFAEHDQLDEDDLLLGSNRQPSPGSSPLERFVLPPEGIPFEEIERKVLVDAMRMSNGNQSKAARLLDLSRDAFRYRLEKHELI